MRLGENARLPCRLCLNLLPTFGSNRQVTGACTSSPSTLVSEVVESRAEAVYAAVIAARPDYVWRLHDGPCNSIGVEIVGSR
jgi:hypothetical protein